MSNELTVQNNAIDVASKVDGCIQNLMVVQSMIGKQLKEGIHFHYNSKFDKEGYHAERQPKKNEVPGLSKSGTQILKKGFSLIEKVANKKVTRGSDNLTESVEVDVDFMSGDTIVASGSGSSSRYEAARKYSKDDQMHMLTTVATKRAAGQAMIDFCGGNGIFSDGSEYLDIPKTATDRDKSEMFSVAKSRGYSTDDMRDVIKDETGEDTTKNLTAEDVTKLIKYFTNNKKAAPDA